LADKLLLLAKGSVFGLELQRGDVGGRADGRCDVRWSGGRVRVDSDVFVGGRTRGNWSRRHISSH
jgi:hypothetical protein